MINNYIQLNNMLYYYNLLCNELIKRNDNKIGNIYVQPVKEKENYVTTADVGR